MATKRPCPAKGSLISAADCGEQRGSRLQVPADEVRTELEAKPEFQLLDDDEIAPDDQPVARYAWLRKGESKQIEAALPEPFRHDNEESGVGTLGNVKLFAGRLVIETFSQVKQEFARRIIERYLGNRIAFEKESVVDVARQMADRMERGEDANDNTRFPHEKFLTDPVPSLDGATPLEAAGDPVLRPRLVELIKQHIHSVETNARQGGLALSIDWVVDRLGLHELE
jgi:hypothetical protein